MRVLVLVITILGLTSAAPARNESKALNGIDKWLENALEGNDHEEMQNIADRELEACMKESMASDLLKRLEPIDEKEEVQCYYTQYLQGCILKKVFIDKLKEKGPAGKTPDAKKRYQFYYKCIVKQSELAGGQNVALGKAVMEDKVCGTYKP